MQKGDYFNEAEAELSEVSASYKNEWAEDKQGKLICTDSRIVFLNNSEITDINLQSVDAMEYKPLNIDMSYIYGGFLMVVIGVILATVDSIPFLSEAGSIVGGLVAVLGLAIIGMVYFNQKAILWIHTPKKSFKFISDSDRLVDIVRSVRSI